MVLNCTTSGDPRHTRDQIGFKLQKLGGDLFYFSTICPFLFVCFWWIFGGTWWKWKRMAFFLVMRIGDGEVHMAYYCLKLSQGYVMVIITPYYRYLSRGMYFCFLFIRLCTLSPHTCKQKNASGTMYRMRFEHLIG